MKLHLYESGHTKNTFDPDAATLSAYPKLQNALASCKKTGAGAQSTLAIVAPVVGKMLFDLYMDKRARDLEALKASAEKSYHARIVLHADALKGAVSRGQCFVLIRISGNDPVPQFISVLALKNSAQILVPGEEMEAFTFTPTYIAVRSAVAVTKNTDKPRISASFALSMRAIGKQDNGLPSFVQVGEAAVTVPGLLIGQISQEGGTKCSSQECPQSDPIPVIPSDADKQTVVIGIGVTEKGDVGVDFDAAKSELSAIKAAIGPVVSDVLKEKLK